MSSRELTAAAGAELCTGRVGLGFCSCSESEGSFECVSSEAVGSGMGTLFVSACRRGASSAEGVGCSTGVAFLFCGRSSDFVGPSFVGVGLGTFVGDDGLSKGSDALWGVLATLGVSVFAGGSG